MNNKECHTNCYETLLVCKVFSWNSFIVFVDPAMSWPNEVNSCSAIGYPSRQILKPQTGTQIYDCKVFFFATSRKFETSQGEVCWDSGTNFFSTGPLTDLLPVYAAQCPIISRKWKSAHREGLLMRTCLHARQIIVINPMTTCLLFRQPSLACLARLKRHRQGMSKHACSQL